MLLWSGCFGLYFFHLEIAGTHFFMAYFCRQASGDVLFLMQPVYSLTVLTDYIFVYRLVCLYLIKLFLN